MDMGATLALQAVVLGLRRSGAIPDHAVTVIIDELRHAARHAREQISDGAANGIEGIAHALRGEVGGARSPRG